MNEHSRASNRPRKVDNHRETSTKSPENTWGQVFHSINDKKQICRKKEAGKDAWEVGACGKNRYGERRKGEVRD